MLDEETAIFEHLVMVGYGRVEWHIVSLLETMSIPYLVIDSDPELIEELRLRGIPTLFGDEANSAILNRVGLEEARALVVAGSDEAASEFTVAATRQIAPNLPIVERYH